MYLSWIQLYLPVSSHELKIWIIELNKNIGIIQSFLSGKERENVEIHGRGSGTPLNSELDIIILWYTVYHRNSVVCLQKYKNVNKNVK